jgi:hypothetical protein
MTREARIALRRGVIEGLRLRRAPREEWQRWAWLWRKIDEELRRREEEIV